MNLMNWLKKRSSDSTDYLDSPLKERELGLDVEESPEGQCSTQVHGFIDELCEEIPAGKLESTCSKELANGNRTMKLTFNTGTITFESYVFNFIWTSGVLYVAFIGIRN